MKRPGTALELESVVDDDLLEPISNTLSVKSFSVIMPDPMRGSTRYVVPSSKLG